MSKKTYNAQGMSAEALLQEVSELLLENEGGPVHLTYTVVTGEEQKETQVNLTITMTGATHNE